MASQILVSLSSYRIEQIMPYITEVAKPGTRVVFLIPYPIDHRAWLGDHWVTTECPRKATLAGQHIIETYSPERQRELAEEIVGRWPQVLDKMGVAVSVDVYTGSFASAVKTYARHGEVSLVMEAQNRFPLVGFFHRAMAFCRFLKRVGHPPVLLHRPGL
jgi:hypothetical protein